MIKRLLKIFLTILALYLVYQQVDVDQLGSILSKVDWLWLFPALFSFLVAKLIASFRIQTLYKTARLPLDTIYNIRLYLVGMYYNIFLPGGIGGDAYKIVVLKNVEGVKVRQLIMASLLDRVSGLFSIVFLALAVGAFSSIYISLIELRWLFWFSIISVFPIYFILVKTVFAGYWKVSLNVMLYSLSLQIFIMLTVFSILQSLEVYRLFIEYYTLFMIAAVAASLPITLGGIGIREAVIVYLPDILDVGIDKDIAVALSLLFLTITLLTSLMGAFVKLGEPKLKPEAIVKVNSN